MTEFDAFLLISEMISSINDDEKNRILEQLDISDEAFDEAREIVFNSN